MTRKVFCTFTFEAFHRWEDAPAEVSFLRDRHRHRFHVRAEAAVDNNDRQIEFILLQRKLSSAIELLRVSSGSLLSATESFSCEDWCEFLLNGHPELSAVEVSEDGENGARVERE